MNFELSQNSTSQDEERPEVNRDEYTDDERAPGCRLDSRQQDNDPEQNEQESKHEEKAEPKQQLSPEWDLPRHAGGLEEVAASLGGPGLTARTTHQQLCLIAVSRRRSGAASANQLVQATSPGAVDVIGPDGLAAVP